MMTMDVLKEHSYFPGPALDSLLARNGIRYQPPAAPAAMCVYAYIIPPLPLR